VRVVQKPLNHWGEPYGGRKGLESGSFKAEPEYEGKTRVAKIEHSLNIPLFMK
jgi:hypothetical protein